MAKHFSEQDNKIQEEASEGLSTAAYFWYLVLYCIPVMGLIFSIIFSVSKKNEARRHFSRAVLILKIICDVVICLLVVFDVIAIPAGVSSVLALG